jgi:chorismate mutase
MGCSSLDSKIDEKNNDLIKTLKERIDLGDQLNMTKESTNKIIKCYNMSMKAASHTIARTIIEMIAREHAQNIYLSVEKLMHQFRLEKKYPVSD